MTERTEPGIYAALPDGAAGAMPWVLACHGSGRCAQSYRDVPFYAAQRDLALSAGYAFAACDLGPDTYGTPRGLEKLDAFYRWALKNLPVRPLAALWASSAGGAAMFRFAGAFPERVSLMLGTFPVWDLLSVTHLEIMRAAWGDLTGEALARAVAHYNPAVHPDWARVAPVVITHGRNDRAVPVEKNALALQRAVGGQVRLFLTGDGHSTEAFGLYRTPLFAEALANRCDA